MALLQYQTNSSKITVKDAHGKAVMIPRLQPSVACRMLGVQIASDGNNELNDASTLHKWQPYRKQSLPDTGSPTWWWSIA